MLHIDFRRGSTCAWMFILATLFILRTILTQSLSAKKASSWNYLEGFGFVHVNYASVVYLSHYFCAWTTLSSRFSFTCRLDHMRVFRFRLNALLCVADGHRTIGFFLHVVRRVHAYVDVDI